MMEEQKENKIMVSIISLAYNHASYIRECLDGFMMQKTNFAFEVLIHDDASTDGTADIIREYEAKYPDIIKPIYQTENQYSKGIPIGCTYLYPRAKGKYIALCEGDDYWTDPLKLQKQVDFLESHPDYVMCGHRIISYEEKNSNFSSFDSGIDGTYKLSDLIYKGVFCSTLSVMFRHSSINLKRFSLYRIQMDISLAFHLLLKGPGFCLNDVMAVYRIHENGVWSGSDEDYHIKRNINVRMAIDDVEQNHESAIFIQTYIKQIGRLWMLKNLSLIANAIFRIYKQFGIKYIIKLILSLMHKA